MKLRKIATMATAAVMTMSMLTGCGSESYKVEYKPVKGDEYGVVSTMSIEASQNSQKMTVGTDVKGTIKFTDVTDDEVTTEVTYDDFSMNMDMAGISMQIDENNEMFKDLVNEIKSMKIKMTTNKDGELLNCDVEGNLGSNLSEYGLDFSNGDNYLMSGKSSILENMEISEGDTISIPLEQLLGDNMGSQMGVAFDEDSKLEGKVNSIKNDVAEVEINIDDLKLSDKDVEFADFKAMVKVNVKTGMTESMTISTNMKGTVEGKIDMKVTTTKR